MLYSIGSRLHHLIAAWTRPDADLGPVKSQIGHALRRADTAAWCSYQVWVHPANHGSPARTGLAIARLLRIWFRWQVLHQPTRVRIGDRSVMWGYPNRWITVRVVFANPPDQREMLYWKRYLKRDDVFIDVGANVGSYSIWAAELGARVIALEPADDTYALLNENIRLNGYQVRTLKAAAGSASGTVRFTSGLDDQNRMDDAGDIEVEAVTLDSIIGDAEIAGMKIDVEGSELEVLRGCERALSEQRIALIQLECWCANPSSVADLLRKHGYSLFRPDSTGELVPLSDLSVRHDNFACPAASPSVPGHSR